MNEILIIMLPLVWLGIVLLIGWFWFRSCERRQKKLDVVVIEYTNQVKRIDRMINKIMEEG